MLKNDWKYYSVPIRISRKDIERPQKLRAHYAIRALDDALEKSRKRIEVEFSGITQYHHGDAIKP